MEHEYDEQGIKRVMADMLQDVACELRYSPERCSLPDFNSHIDVGVLTTAGRRVIQVSVSCRVLTNWPDSRRPERQGGPNA